jgi:hypothetical protein|tara:strand:+ start:3144 stop:3365 length:222 start_codon:yes stop_codon:yes gene_type:complete
MKIKQNKKTGEGRIEFSNEEIALLNKRNYFEITPLAMKHLANKLVNMAAEFTENLPEEVAKVQSFDNTKIDTK